MSLNHDKANLADFPG